MPSRDDDVGAPTPIKPFELLAIQSRGKESPSALFLPASRTPETSPQRLSENSLSLEGEGWGEGVKIEKFMDAL